MNVNEDVEVYCPYCGEPFAIMVDTTGGDFSMVEDCAICCRPIAFTVRCEPGEVLGVETAPG